MTKEIRQQFLKTISRKNRLCSPDSTKSSSACRRIVARIAQVSEKLIRRLFGSGKKPLKHLFAL